MHTGFSESVGVFTMLHDSMPVLRGEPMLYHDPPSYDRIHDAFTEDIPFWIDVARQAMQTCPEGVVVELACGTGRVTVPLAEAGIPIIGVDNAEAMLLSARERARRCNLNPDNPRFVRGDMVDCASVLMTDRPVSAVIIPLHSLSHLLTWEDLLRGLTAIRNVLHPAGILALALHVPDLAVLCRDETAMYPLDIAPGIGYEQTRYDANTQVLHSTWWLEDENGDVADSAEFALRMIFPQELNLLLHAAGFVVTHRYGWYDYAEVQEYQGTQIVVAQCP